VPSPAPSEAAPGGPAPAPAEPATAPAPAEPAAAPAPAAPAAAPAPAAPAPAAPSRPVSALEALAQAAAASKAGAPGAPGRAAAREERPDALVGTQVNGFKIQSRIGSGGFGVVYKAFDTNLERSVAIKMLPPKIAKAGQGLVERFLREARSAAKLSHPNIVTIHQICPYKDTYYIVMELVDGGALHEFLSVQKRFPSAEATRVIRAAAEGLGHAHRRGIIHRDVKPGNIMLTNDGQVKVSDFGLARDVLQGRDIVGPGHSLGTPRYMAPEQALGDEPTASSDLYSLAATYYTLLTGRPPFDAVGDREIMKKHVTEPVPDPRLAVAELPVAVYRFFEKAMAKQPEDRYLTAEEFIEALDRLDFAVGADGLPPTAQALSAQIGQIAAEDRGSHLTEALGRAVRRAQRQRTPSPMRAATPVAAPQLKRKRSRWWLWLLLALGALVLIGGAIAAAIFLTPKKPTETTGGAPTTTPTPEPGPTPSPGPGPAVPPPEAGKAGEPVVTPPGPGPAPTPTPPKPPATDPLEKAAQDALAEIKKVENDPNLPPEELIRLYEENILAIQAYAKTKAYEEAKQAVKRLKGGPPPENKPAPPAPKSNAKSGQKAPEKSGEKAKK
jgi:hypothetical protein